MCMHDNKLINAQNETISCNIIVELSTYSKTSN